MESTLLERSTVAYVEAVEASSYPGHTWRTRRLGVAAVLVHLAAEIVVECQHRKLDPHDIAELFCTAAKDAQQ